jgi:hypothetical protein
VRVLKSLKLSSELKHVMDVSTDNSKIMKKKWFDCTPIYFSFFGNPQFQTHAAVGGLYLVSGSSAGPCNQAFFVFPSI